MPHWPSAGESLDDQGKQRTDTCHAPQVVVAADEDFRPCGGLFKATATMPGIASPEAVAARRGRLLRRKAGHALPVLDASGDRGFRESPREPSLARHASKEAVFLVTTRRPAPSTMCCGLPRDTKVVRSPELSRYSQGGSESVETQTALSSRIWGRAPHQSFPAAFITNVLHLSTHSCILNLWTCWLPDLSGTRETLNIAKNTAFPAPRLKASLQDQ